MREDRKVAFILDRCQHAQKIEGLKAVELIFLPSHTTSKNPPVDKGVIRSIKAIYHTKVIQRIIREVDAGKGIPNVLMLDAMQLLQSAWSEITETTVQNCFRKAGIKRKAEEEVLYQNDDSFKDFTADDDMEFDETIEDLRTRFPEEAPLQCNTATLLKSYEGIATSSDKPTDVDILAFIREKLPFDIEEKDDIEVEEEPLECPARFKVDKAVKTLQQSALFCDYGVEIGEMVGIINMMAKTEYSARKKQSTIMHCCTRV